MTQTKTRRTRRTYTDEFKNHLVQFYLNGKRKCDIVHEYDIASSLLDKWIKQLKMENDILKQAALILGRR